MKLPRRTAALAVTLALAFATVPGLVHAERADRDKPVDIEADHMTVDDRNKVHVFDGSVVLTQGTLVIKADRLVVTQDAAGFQTGVATGSAKRLATFRQKRDGSDEYVEGEAERIEYDSRNERARLFNQAHVKSGGDEVRGRYIEYDALTENYVATNQPGAADSAAAPVGRVRATIQPKGPSAEPPAPSGPAPTPADEPGISR